MDETVYTLADNLHKPQDPIAAEGARSQWRQLAVLPTKTACEAAKAQQVTQAVQTAEATQQAQPRPSGQPQQMPVYPPRQRFFCSPEAPGG
jgi:hypothetical protein